MLDSTPKVTPLARLVPRALRPGVKRLIGYDERMRRRQVQYRQQQRLVRRPRLLTEKIVYKMAYDRRPILTTFADKVAVRDYIAARVGPDVLATVIAVANSPEGIDWESLPEQYVAKASHGSGGNVIVTNIADADARLPEVPVPGRWGMHVVRREHADPARLRSIFAEWLSLNYADTHGDPVGEWCYQDIPPRILVEEYLQDDDGTSPPDFKLFVLNGHCRFIQVELNRVRGHQRVTMTPEWTPVPVVTGYPLPASPPVRPTTLERMIAIAETLGDGIDFVRVDLYCVGDRVIVGELTNYPEAARVRFRPQSFDRRMGRLLTLADYRQVTSGMLGG